MMAFFLPFFVTFSRLCWTIHFFDIIVHVLHANCTSSTDLVSFFFWVRTLAQLIIVDFFIATNVFCFCSKGLPCGVDCFWWAWRCCHLDWVHTTLFGKVFHWQVLTRVFSCFCPWFTICSMINTCRSSASATLLVGGLSGNSFLVDWEPFSHLWDRVCASTRRGQVTHRQYSAIIYKTVSEKRV